MNGVTPTVVVLNNVHASAKRLDEALREVAPVTKIALQNGNRLHVVILSDMTERLTGFAKGGILGAKPEDVHLFAGAHDVQKLASAMGDSVGSKLLEYLKQSHFFDRKGPMRMHWMAATWCSSTRAAFDKRSSMMLNRSITIDKHQYDVSCTLSSLVQHSERVDALAQPRFPWRDFGSMRGQLGPAIKAGREGKEAMRAIHWKSPSAPDAIVMLLPEAYVRYMFKDYMSDTKARVKGSGCIVGGKLVFSNGESIPMRRPDVSEAEQMVTAQMLGPRIWRLTASTGDAPEYVFETCASATDPLLGLVVKWTFAPGEGSNARDMPTLDVASESFETLC